MENIISGNLVKLFLSLFILPKGLITFLFYEQRESGNQWLQQLSVFHKRKITVPSPYSFHTIQAFFGTSLDMT